MMNKLMLLLLALVLLACGCTDNLTADLDLTSGKVELNHSYVTAPAAIFENCTTIQTEDIVPNHFIQNWTAQNITYGSNWTRIDDNIRGIIIDYHFAGKEWKYITIDGATCHEIPCEFEGAYCLKCEELT